MDRDLNRIKRNAGLIAESDTAPVISSYKAALAARDWVVTPDQAATINNALNILIPLTKSLSDGAQQLSMDGMLNPEESRILRQAIELLKSLQVPVAILKVEEPRRLKLPGS